MGRLKLIEMAFCVPCNAEMITCSTGVSDLKILQIIDDGNVFRMVMDLWGKGRCTEMGQVNREK